MKFVNAAMPVITGFDTTPTAPPGVGKIVVLLQWLAWGVSFICFAVFIAAIGKIAYQAMHGRESDGIKVAVIALICAILLGAAGAIMANLGVK